MGLRLALCTAGFLPDPLVWSSFSFISVCQASAPSQGSLASSSPLSPLGRIIFSVPVFQVSWASLDPSYTQPCRPECSSALAEATPTSERRSKALHPGKGTPKSSAQERDRREAGEAVNVAATLWWLWPQCSEAGSLELSILVLFSSVL